MNTPINRFRAAVAAHLGQALTPEVAAGIEASTWPSGGNTCASAPQLGDAHPSDEQILDLCAGRQDALDLIRGVWAMCEVWDDAIDGDRKEGDDFIHRTFCWMLFELPSNPLWRECPSLASALRVVIANWKAANALERTRDLEHLATAYTLRCSPYDFFVAVVLAAAGPDAADRAALMFRGATSRDRFADYLNEHLGDGHGLAKC